VEAVRHGLRNGSIATALGVSVDAVKYHVGNALQKLGLASRAQLRQWTGVSRESAMHNREPPMNDATAFGALGQISRHVRDIAAARQWYGDVLGLRHLYTYGKLSFFDCGGVRLFLSESDGAEGDSILYFRVAHIQAERSRLLARGVEFTHAPHCIHRHEDGTEEWMAFFKDNEGRALGIMAQVAPTGTSGQK